MLWPLSTNAAQLTTRSIRLGTSKPSVATSHNFSFVLSTAGPVGSIDFEYCTNTPYAGTPCTVPAGLSALAATLSTQTGETGFSIHANTTANRIVISRAAAAAAAQPVTYNFSNVTNPSTERQSVYVRISTFASTDGTGARTDDGAVVFSIADLFSATGFVPPHLTFCAGVAVALNCTTTTGNFLDVGELTAASTATATSQFSGSTNDVSGYTVYTLGQSMTSGVNVIAPSVLPSPSAAGTNQFGINLRDNSIPDIGLDPGGIGTGAPLVDYNSPNLFKYENGGPIVSSSLSTHFNRFTVSYVVNVNGGLPPGFYNTTLTYLAVAAF